MEIEHSPRLTLLLILLTLIGLAASFYVPATTIELAAKFYIKSASPYSLDWMGTSLLIDLLEEKGYRISIVNNYNEFIENTDLFKNKSIVLLIAPDKPISPEFVEKLRSLLESGKIDLVVADENTTSNGLLINYGVKVSGHGILLSYPSGVGINVSNPFPPAIFFLPENTIYQRIVVDNKTFYIPASLKNSYVIRLNWASFIEFYPIQGISYEYYLLGITKGYIDFDDNGILSVDEIIASETYLSSPESYSAQIIPGYLIVGVYIKLENADLAVLGDSFFFTNQAISSGNTTYAKYVVSLIDLLSKNKSETNHIIIPNFIYTPKSISVKTPYHPAILLYFASRALGYIDDFLTRIFFENTLVTLSSLGIIITIIAFLFLYIMGYKGFKTIEPTSVDEITLISETYVKKSLLVGGKGVNYKEAIVGLWNILNYSIKKLLGYNIMDIINDPRLLNNFAKSINIDPRELYNMVSWMYLIYLKITKRKKLPLIISWKRTLKKYILYSERILEAMGYTITRRVGYRGIEEILH